MKKEELESFLEMPYAKRKLIVVADDPVVEKERATMASKGAESNEVDWTTVFKKSLPYISPAIAIGIEVAKAVNAARDQGVNVLSVSRSESSVLQFPLGHPQDGVLYVGHPAVCEIYYPTAQFHRLTFEHKLSEAIELLMALGAIEINVEHQVGWGKEFSTNLNVPTGKEGEHVGTTASGDTEKQRHVLFQISLEGTSDPSVPDELVWFPQEPTWQQVARGRIKYGMKSFSISLRYENDFGINADLEVMAGKAGLNLGGKFKNHESTIWKVQGSFKTS